MRLPGLSIQPIRQPHRGCDHRVASGRDGALRRPWRSIDGMNDRFAHVQVSVKSHSRTPQRAVPTCAITLRRNPVRVGRFAISFPG